MSATITAVRERPIIFSGEMVRAILEGRKTQTRRVIGIQPLEILTPRSRTANALGRVTRKWGDKRVWFSLTERGATPADNHGVAFSCKYGEVGDRLWVREAFRCAGRDWSDGYPVYYRAESVGIDEAIHRWRPSIHMPRWASRLTLEIIGTSIESVQDITKADARAEGITLVDEREGYAALWDALNAKRPGASWSANPWVWVIEFRRLNGAA